MGRRNGIISRSPRVTRKRGWLAVVVGMAVVASLAAVASNGSAASKTQTAPLRPLHKIVFVNPLKVYPSFSVVNSCLKKEATKLGYQSSTVGTPGSAVNNSGTINLIDQQIANGVDGMLVFPTDNALFTPVFKQARAKGIYVIALESGDPSTGEQSRVGTNAFHMGEIVADGVGATDPNAHVAILSVSPTLTEHVMDTAGFAAEARKKFPNMKIDAHLYDSGDSTKDVDLISNALTAHPDLTVIYSIVGTGEPAAITAVKEHGLVGKVKIVSLDLTAEHKADIKAGKILGVGEQGWCEMGTEAVILMRKLSEGKKVPASFDTGEKFYTRANLPTK
jgi:ribose transport system substrate-binding protein